jgi:hypothetical protein
MILAFELEFQGIDGQLKTRRDAAVGGSFRVSRSSFAHKWDDIK